MVSCRSELYFCSYISVALSYILAISELYLMLYLSYISHCNRFHCTVNSVLQYIVHILFYSTSLCSIVHLCVLALFPSGFCVLVRTFHPSVLPQFYTVLTCTTCTACITLYRSVLDLASHRIASQYISVCTSLYVHLCVL